MRFDEVGVDGGVLGLPSNVMRHTKKYYVFWEPVGARALSRDDVVRCGVAATVPIRLSFKDAALVSPSAEFRQECLDSLFDERNGLVALLTQRGSLHCLRNFPQESHLFHAWVLVWGHWPLGVLPLASLISS